MKILNLPQNREVKNYLPQNREVKNYPPSKQEY